MKVSVILVNYNTKQVTTECINSVLKSNYPDFEIIVVDNASKDGSWVYLKRKFNRNKKIKLVKTDKNLNYTGGNNLGALHAKGQKIVFLNNDTIVDKNWITELVKLHREKPKSLVQPKILSYRYRKIIDNAGGIYQFPGIGSGRGHGEKDRKQYDQSKLIDYTTGTCYLIDRNFFKKLGGFDNWYQIQYEDIDLSLRAKKQGGSCWYCPKSIIYHHRGYTLKRKIPKEENLFNVRKNRIVVILKNFTAWEKTFRLLILVGLYLVLIIQDLFTFKRKRILLTLRAINLAINWQIKQLIERCRIKELKRIIGKKSFQLLDAGCGEGVLVRLANQKNIKAFGVDTTSLFDSQIIHSKFENLKTKKKFDAITMYHFLEHTQDPKKVLKKAKDFLKRNGLLVVEVPLIGNLTEKFLQKDHFAYHDKTHLHFFTKEKIATLINQSGFKIKKKGFTQNEFPVTVLTSSFKKGFLRGLLGIILFLPLKLLSILGINEEIARFYCQPKT